MYYCACSFVKSDLPENLQLFSEEITNDIVKLVKNEIKEGREDKVQVVVYMQGDKVADIVFGVGCSPDTRFMAYSTTKGVFSTMIARVLHKAGASYTDRVSKHWPEFAAHGKEDITIAEALSHRAGLRARSLCALRTLYLAFVSTRRLPRLDEAMATGVSWIASCRPSWRGRQYARYHPTSWSWMPAAIQDQLVGW